MPLSELATLRAEYERKIAALWHGWTCPYDHCERCIADAPLIKAIRDEQKAAGAHIPRCFGRASEHEETE